MTDLPNRRLFNDRLDQAMGRSSRHQTLVAVLSLDVDKFKTINDTLGHDQGDLLLKIFATRLKQATRATDTVARMGGDEFTIVMDEFTMIEDVENVADKILNEVRKPFVLGNQSMAITTSIGIAIYAGEISSRDAVIKVSDEALYLSKNQGRNRYTLRHVSTRSMPAQVLTKESKEVAN